MRIPPLDTFRLDGKTALVTGGAGLLGRGYAEGLASAGAKVAIVDMQEQAAAGVAAAIGPNAAGFACDVSDPLSVKACGDSVRQRFGRIDILHNNAATKTADPRKFFAPLDEYSLEVWRDVMSVNIDGMFLMVLRMSAISFRERPFNHRKATSFSAAVKFHFVNC